MSMIKRSSQGPHKAAQDPPDRFQMITILRNAMKTKKNHDFEMALDALGKLPNINKGSPMAPQSGQEMA